MQTQPLSFPDARKGFSCPCCGQYVKQYRRSFNSNMALCLLAMYKHSKGEYVHVEKLLNDNGYQRCGDFSYMRFYGLIQPLKEKREDGSPRNGYYRITAMGTMFVEGKHKVQKHFLIKNNKFEGFEGEEINIRQALTEKFDYEKLMKN